MRTLMSENVNGLTTAALTDGEFLKGDGKVHGKKEDAGSLIQLTQDLDSQAQALLKMLEEQDADMESRWSKVSDKLESLERKYRR